MANKNGVILKSAVGLVGVIFVAVLTFMGNGIVANDLKSCAEDIKIKEIHNEDMKDVRYEIGCKHDKAMNEIAQVKEIVSNIRVEQKVATIEILKELKKIERNQ